MHSVATMIVIRLLGFACFYLACPDGFIGRKCEIACIYPNYGKECQFYCRCSEALCNISVGCTQGTNIFIIFRIISVWCLKKENVFNQQTTTWLQPIV